MSGNSVDNGQVSNRVRCEECGKKGATLAVKIDECLRPSRARLCTPCRKKKGFRPLTFDRSPPGTWGTLA